SQTGDQAQPQQPLQQQSQEAAHAPQHHRGGGRRGRYEVLPSMIIRLTCPCCVRAEEATEDQEDQPSRSTHQSNKCHLTNSTGSLIFCGILDPFQALLTAFDAFHCGAGSALLSGLNSTW